MAEDKKKVKDEDVAKILYGEEAYRTFEIFYRFKAANLIPDFKAAIELYDQNPKIISFLFNRWMQLSKSAPSQDKDVADEVYQEFQHRQTNSDVDSENPHAWEFVKFSDLNMISRNTRKFKDAVLRYALKNGLNQKALAEKLDISSQAMSQFFKSDKVPRPTTLTKIGSALGVDGVYIHHPELEGDGIEDGEKEVK